MARSRKPAAPESASYQGEVWTDARGYATVRLPAEVRRRPHSDNQTRLLMLPFWLPKR